MGGGALGEDTGKTYSAIFKQISIAGKPFGPLLFRFMPNTFSTIGNGFFEDYTITFNWSLDRIGLSRYGSRKRNLTPPTFGFNYSLNQASGFLYIGFIYNQSPAQQAGLAVGDRILAVNGTRLTKVSTSTFCEFYLDPQKLLGSDNHIELVILRQGQEKTIHLEKKSLLTSH